ncbi:MAG: metal ABC transporter substrate-binding protein [Cyanobacteria bacterium J06621_12]
MFKFSANQNRVKHLLSIFVAGVAASAIAENIRVNNIAQANDKPKVVASHNIICDLVQTIAQDSIDLTCLIDSNQDPHTYRPTPKDLQAIESAQLIFYGGYELEPLITQLLAGVETPKIALYEQAVSQPIMAEHHDHGDHDDHDDHEDHDDHDDHDDHSDHGDHEDHEDHEDHGDHNESSKAEAAAELEPDPHVWHDVENAVKMVDSIQSTLLQLNATAAETYSTNSVNFSEQLWQLDGWITDQINTIPPGQKTLVTTHDALNYYVQAYGLEDYQTLQGLSAASSPTASQVRELSKEIKQAGIPTIFAESTKSDRVLQNVARAADVKLSPQPLYVDGLGQAENYTEMMSHNTCAIVDGLGGECQAFEPEITP